MQNEVRYAGERKPHKEQVHSFDQESEAIECFVRVALNERIGKPSLTGSVTVLEHYVTKGGLIVALTKTTDGNFRIVLWRSVSTGKFYEEQLLMIDDRKSAERRVMDHFGAVCAAERAIAASSAQAKAA